MEQTAPKQWPFLDIVRSGAALLVLFGHARWFHFGSMANVDRPALLTKAFYFLTGLQHEAVVLFFVVSGFLVGGGLWRNFALARFNALQYLINRFVRIFIVFLPALLLVAVITKAGLHFLGDTRVFMQLPFSPVSPQMLICHLACLQGVFCSVAVLDPPLWSLSYEWILYLLAPLFLACLFAPLDIRWRGVALVVLTAVTTTVLPNFVEYSWFMLWGLGACAAIWIAQGGTSIWLGIVGLALVLAGCLLARQHLVPLLATDSIIGIGVGLALTCLPVMSWSPAPRLFAFLASFSYSLYVIHYPVATFVAALLQREGWPTTPTQPGQIAYFAFAITVAVALLSALVLALLTEYHTETVRRAVGKLAR